ncbi:Os10g0360600, partial [Oryza sativa Japonica Group]
SHFPLATSPPLPDLAEGRGVGSGAGRGGGGGSVGVGAAGWEIDPHVHISSIFWTCTGVSRSTRPLCSST